MRWPWKRAPDDDLRHVCPICEDDKPRARAVRLYGHLVCRRCANAFTNRRAAAFLVDRILFLTAAFAVNALVSQLDPAAGKAAFFVIAWGLYTFRDGFEGRSPGKVFLGLHVVSERTGRRAGFLDSLGRNAVLLVPFMPLIAASQLPGKRAGDGFAGTRVVWARHASSRVFRD